MQKTAATVEPDVLHCEAASCDRPETDDDPLVQCEHYGWLHDSCHLAICQSRTCHRALYGDPDWRE